MCVCVCDVDDECAQGFRNTEAELAKSFKPSVCVQKRVNTGSDDDISGIQAHLKPLITCNTLRLLLNSIRI